MNATILNREFQHPADGWYQIEPKGEHPNRRAQIVQVIDDQAVEEIVNRFNAEADKPGFPGLLIDHEHFRHDQSQETRAYGWLMRLQNRADGIYGQVKWTATGRAAVDGGDYRFFSTEYAPEDLVALNRGQKPARVRPVKLDGLSLTNDPNNKGGRPITNREGDLRPGTVPSADKAENKNQRTKMKSVATKLGLSADASEEAVLAEVTKIMNRATDAEGKITPLQTRVTALETENGALLGEQIDSDLAAHGVKDEKVVNRVRPVLVGLKNRAERVSFIELFGSQETKETKGTEGTRQVLNRADAKNPGAKGAGEPANEQEKAQKILNRANELRGSAPGRSWESCWNQAVSEATK